MHAFDFNGYCYNLHTLIVFLLFVIYRLICTGSFTVTDSAKPLTYRSDDTDADNSIELVEEQVTAKVSSIKDGVTSSSDILKPSIISANILLVSLYMISSVLKV